MVLYHRLEAIALDNMAKKYGFSPFLAKLPPEMTPVTPGGRTENLKTVKYVRSDPYLVCKLHIWRLNSIWGHFFKQNCQKTYILGHFLYKCIGNGAN